MKALKTIQTLCKVVKIICIIVFVCSVIGLVGCVIGAIVLPAMKDKVINDGKTLEMILLENKVSYTTAFASTIIGAISCAVSIFLSKITWMFFNKELALGTPFNKPLVKEMRKLALIHIIVSFVLLIGFAIAVGVIKANDKSMQDLKNFGDVGTIGFGISLLIVSLFCEYGAEKEEEPIVVEAVEPNKEA